MRDYLLKIPIFFVNFYHPLFLFPCIKTVKRLYLRVFFTILHDNSMQLFRGSLQNAEHFVGAAHPPDKFLPGFEPLYSTYYNMVGNFPAEVYNENENQ